MRPPSIPQCSDIFSRRSFENAQVRCLEKTSHTKKHRLNVLYIFAQRFQRQSLGDQRKRQFVFLVTERGSQILEERLIAPVVVDLIANPSGLLLQAKLRRGIKHTADVLFGQFFEWRLTTARSCQREVCAKHVGQNRGIDANLRHVAIRFRSSEKLALTFLDEHVEDRLFKCGIGRVTVCFPAAVVHIEFDAAADRITAIYLNCGIAKIRSRLAVPGAELNDVELVTGNTDKMFAEIPAEPACLKLQLIWNA